MPHSRSLSLIALVASLAACDGSDPIPMAPGPNTANAGSGDVPVTAIVADADAAIAPSLQIRSDGLGPYTNSNSLTSVLQPIGAWVLDSYNPRRATRRLYLDFGQPIAGSGPSGGAPIAVPSALYKLRAISKCHLLGTSFQTLAPGASMPCPLHIAFDYSGSSYAVQMNPGPSSGDPEGNAPETNYAAITCVAPSSGAGPCTGWTVTPSGSYVDTEGTTRSGNVAKLLKYVTSKGKTVATNQGDFYFSFQIGVGNP